MKKIVFRILLLLTAVVMICSNAESQIINEWTKKYYPVQNSAQTVYDMTVDEESSMYLTGSNTAGYGGTDMVIVKYDYWGNYIWTMSYSYEGAPYSFETGKCIGTYSNGSKNYIYAAGEVSYTAMVKFIVILKYDSDGNQLWGKSYASAPFGYSHTLNKMIVDRKGNCYITGTNGQSLFLSKYDSTGLQKYGIIYTNPPGYNTGSGHDMAVDSLENVYITGHVVTTTSNIQYVYLKYDAAGSLIQNKLSGNLGINVNVKNKIQICPSGNSYVGGNIGYDYYLVKYNSSGDTVWARRYNGASNNTDYFNSLCVDNNERITMTGIVNGIYGDVGTLRYDSSGTLLWAKTLAGSNGWSDVGKDVIADTVGAAYVIAAMDESTTGKTVMIKYNSSGDTAWTLPYDFAPGDYEGPVVIKKIRSLLMAAGNCVYYNQSDMSLMRVDVRGIYDKIFKRYNASQITNHAINSTVSDDYGNIYTAGKIRTAGYGDDINIMKYNSAGTQKWLYQRGSLFTFDLEDVANAIAVDKNRNVYFTGKMFTGLSEKFNMYTQKLDSNGNQIWSYGILYGGTGNESGEEIAVDNSGNVYVGYNSSVIDTNLNFGVVKYNSTGNIIWVYSYGGPSNESDKIRDMRIDKNGDVYLLANTKTASTGTDIMVTKINSAGGLAAWTATYNGTANGNDDARSIDVDKYGNVYVTGSSRNTTTRNDIVVIKYTNTGAQSWVYTKSYENYLMETGGVVKFDSLSSRVKVAGDAAKLGALNVLYHYDVQLDTMGNVIPGTELYLSYYTTHELVQGGALDRRGVLVSSSELFHEFIGFLNYSSMITRFDTSKISYPTVYNPKGLNKPAVNDPVSPHQTGFYVGVSAYDSVQGQTSTIMKFKSIPITLSMNMFIQGFYRPDLDSNVINDTVKITLRNSAAPFAKVDSVTTVLSKNGLISNASFFNAVSGTLYYVVVNHRNSVETWSKSPVTFGVTTLSLDFTDSAKVYGNNLIYVTDGFTGEYTVYNGDVNQDGFVDLTDLNTVYNSSINFVTGYVTADVTGDNLVDLTDLTLTYNNASSFVSKKRP